MKDPCMIFPPKIIAKDHDHSERSTSYVTGILCDRCHCILQRANEISPRDLLDCSDWIFIDVMKVLVAAK